MIVFCVLVVLGTFLLGNLLRGWPMLYDAWVLCLLKIQPYDPQPLTRSDFFA